MTVLVASVISSKHTVFLFLKRLLCEVKALLFSWSDHRFFFLVMYMITISYPLFHNKLKMRLAMAAWCLRSLAIVTSYNSVLISFIMAPCYPLLISVVEELAANENINPVVVRGFVFDKLISVFKSWRGFFFFFSLSKLLTGIRFN